MDCKNNEDANETSCISMLLENYNTSNLDPCLEKNDLKSTASKVVCWQSSPVIARSTSSNASNLLPREEDPVPIVPSVFKGKERWRAATRTIIRQLRVRLLTDPLSSTPLETIADCNEQN
jgi:hypothetical protein